MPDPSKTPPTQAGNQVNSGKTTCPYAQRKPCDVDKLLLRVAAYDDNWTEGKVGKPGGPGSKKKLTLKLETTTSLRHRKAPTDPKGAKLHKALSATGAARLLVGPEHPARLLQKYDLIIDTIADFPTIKTPGPGAPQWKVAFFKSLAPSASDLVEVEAVRAHFHATADCSYQTHSYLKIHGIDAPELPQDIVQVKPGAQMLEKTSFKLSAPSLPFHDLPTSGFPLFELVKSLLHCTQPRKVEFTAQSCGKRTKGDGKETQPNRELLALLRIYRRDKWTIGVKIPPLGSFKDSRKADQRSDLFGASTGNRTRTQETSMAGGLATMKTTDTVKGGNASQTDERFLAHKGWSEETGNLGSNNYRANRYSDADGRLVDDAGVTTLSNLNMRLSRSSGFSIVLAHNDRELDIAEFIEKFKKGIEALFKVVTNFRSLFEMVPKVGWTFDFTVALFEGWVGLEWAPCYVDDGAPIYDNRYCAVEYKWKGRIELTVIDLKVSVGFGLEIKLAGLAELTAKVEGSLSFKASLAHDVNMDLFKPKEKFEVETSGGPALTAKLNVSVLGYTLVGGQVSVAGGLSLKGYVEIDWSTKAFDLKGVLKRKPVLLTGAIQYPTWYGGTKTRKIDPPIEIIAAGNIHTFG